MIQQLPELHDRIVAGQDWNEIAHHCKENFLVETEESRKVDMQRAMENLAHIEGVMEDPMCNKCGKVAEFRCSRCK